MMGRYIASSKLLQDKFECVTIPIRMSDDVDGLGKLSWKKVSRAFSILRKLHNAISYKRTSLVYISLSINGFGLLRDSLAVLICRIFSVPYVFHLHMRGVRELHEGSFFYRGVYRLIFPRAEVIHLAPSLYEDVAPLVTSEHFHVVANGVPRPAATGNGQSSNSDGPPLILYLSNLFIEKGAADLLAASRLLFAKAIDHRLVFVGAPHDAKLVNEIKQASKEDARIILLPPTYGLAKDELYAKTDIFAFPSYYRYECQPLTIMEAMSHDVAIVASHHAAIPDLIRHNVDGLLYEPRDINGLASALEALVVDQEERKRLSKAALEKFSDAYTLEAFEQRFVSTIDHILTRINGE
jgi:glycosyltransferase involved in cell wall biosynthesis